MFVSGYMSASTVLGSKQSLSLSEAFSSDVLTRFETAINEKTAGLYGDIMVTGMFLVFKYLPKIGFKKIKLYSWCYCFDYRFVLHRL